ncbi:MAG TPA: serine hydrolase [Steroidobacteraceae bacterium]|nr:serine hydrolase [Steroidobacteraceae bacterium]
MSPGGRLIGCLVLLGCVCATSAAWARPRGYRHDPYDHNPYPRAAAAYATVVDGDLLWGHNLDEHRAPASLTKLLTALVLLDSSWNPDAVLTVSRDAAHTTPSRVGLHTGDRVSAEDALKAMLMHSANDACLVLVEHDSPSLAAFAARMNARAAELGMHDSHFVHPCGYDEPGQYSTVNDLLRLARVAHADPRIAEIVDQQQGSILVDSGRRLRHLSFRSTNHLLGHMPGVVGMKTGYTAQAGRCLIALAEQSGHRVWLVLLGSRQRWWVAHHLIVAAFAAAAHSRTARLAALPTHGS